MAQLEVIKGVASQRIWFQAQDGRPSATPSVEVKDQYGNVVSAAATTNVTLENVNTTTTATASKGDRSVTLTSVTLIRLRAYYVIADAYGRMEWVRVYGVNSSTKVVELFEPLEYDYVSGVSFRSHNFYYTLQTVDVANLAENHRARASYALGTLNYTVEIPFDVCLVPLDNPLTKEYVTKHRPDLMSQQHAETLGDDLQDLREAAFERVKEGIRSHQTGWRPALLKTPADLNQWALAEFDMLCIENGIDVFRNLPAIDAFEKAENRRNSMRASSLSALTFMDLNDDDAIEDNEKQPLRLDLVR